MISFSDEKFAAARADFLHIGFDFVQQAVVGCDDDDGHIFVHQGKRPVLQFAGRIGFGVDVGDFLQLQRTFEGNRVMDAAP